MHAFRLIPLILLFMAGLPVHAMSLPAVPTEPVYYEPPVVDITDQLRAQSCYQLDAAIRELHPYSYSYKPPYFQDGSNQLATTLVVFDSIPIVQGWLGLGWLGYSALVGVKEERRMQLVGQQISALQRIKAEKHCFE